MKGGWGMKMSGAASVENRLDMLRDEWGEMQAHTVVADAEHAVYVEYGTVHMPADGSLRDAVSSTVAKIDTLAGRANSADELSRLIAEDIADGYRGSVPVDTGELKSSIHVEKV